MEKIKGYDEVQGFTGEFETIKLGGHICKIIDARVEKTSTKKDMLVVAFDISEGENKEFYKRRFNEDKMSNPVTAKWKGTHRLLLTDNEGNCNKFFKGFITAVESSNNYKWDWDEKTLKGKLFGGVFGQEEYENYEGEIKLATKIRFIRSIDKVKDAPVPEVKRLNNSTSSNNNFFPVESTDELPF